MAFGGKAMQEYRGFGLVYADLEEIDPFAKEAKVKVLSHIAGKLAKRPADWEKDLERLLKKGLVKDCVHELSKRPFFWVTDYCEVLQYLVGKPIKKEVIEVEKLGATKAHRAMVFCIGYKGDSVRCGVFPGAVVVKEKVSNLENYNLKLTNAFVFSADENWKPVSHHEEI